MSSSPSTTTNQWNQNNPSQPSQMNWASLSQQLCTLNISADYLNSTDISTIITQIGTQLNLTQTEINDILQFVQSMNVIQTDIMNILSSCQGIGGSNSGWPSGGSSNWPNNGGGSNWPSNGGGSSNWQGGGSNSGGQGSNWLSNGGGSPDYQSGSQGWANSGGWPRRQEDNTDWRGRGPMRVGMNNNGGGNWPSNQQNDYSDYPTDNQNRTFDLPLAARRQKAFPGRWNSSSWSPRWNNNSSSTTQLPWSSTINGSAYNNGSNDYLSWDYPNSNYNDDYDNGNWTSKQKRIWRWIVLGVCCGIIVLLALSILCIAFYRPRVQHRVVVTPYTNQLYTKDGRIDPPPMPTSPMQVYPEVRY